MNKGSGFLAFCFYALIIGVIGYIIFSGVIKKEVEPIYNETIESSSSVKNINIGENINISDNVKEKNNIHWSSENENVATVDDKGNVKAVGEGTTKIIIKENDNVISTVEVKVDSPVKENTDNKVEEPKPTQEPKNENDKDQNKDNNNSSSSESTTKPPEQTPTKVETPEPTQPKVEEPKQTDNTPTNTNVDVVSISIDKPKLSIAPGNTATLIATISPSNATNKTVTWSSSNTSVATVDSNGNVKGVSAGTATITAKSNNNKVATSIVTVSNPIVEVQNITLDVTSVVLNTPNSKKVNATVTPTNAANKTLTWSSSNTSVATVDSNGNIKAVGQGSAIITVKSNNNISKTISVTVKSVERIHFIPTMAHINADNGHGDSILLESNGHYAMIDTGNASAESRKNLLTYLNKLGIKKLDFILLTHLHSDHYGGINYLLKKNIRVDTLYIKRYSSSLGENYASTYSGIIDCAKGNTDGCTKVSNIVYTQTIDKSTCPEHSNQAHSDFNCTANITFQNMNIKLYNTAYVMKDGDIGPNGKFYKSYKKKDGVYETININYESIYEYITVNNHKIVLAADAVGEYSGAGNLFESDTWYKKIMQDSGTNIDVLKAPHHGDINSDKNYSKLKPKSVVVTNASKNLGTRTGVKDYESYGARLYFAEYYSSTSELKTLYADFTGSNVEFGRIKIYD